MTPGKPSRRPSILTLVLLTVMWVLLWGDLSVGNVVAGLGLAVALTAILPMLRGRKRRVVVRPIALVRLVVRFAWDVIVASTHIAFVILSGRRPREAIIRVRTRAQSDGFLVATAGFTAMVPGSIVLDAHQLTGTLYIHVFDIENDEAALREAHRQVLRQEERILRAFASNEELMDAGFRPGGSMRAGRLSEAEFRRHRASVEAGEEV